MSIRYRGGRISRGTVVGVLVAIEIAVCGEGVVAIRSGQSGPPPSLRVDAREGSQARLAEGGPPRIFAVGAHPTLTVDIGYADLTVVAGTTAEIDVSVSPSHDFGMMGESAPIRAQADGSAVHISTTPSRSFSMGDDRMVTVQVPPDTTIDVVNGGDITANGLRAKSSFHSVGRGSITVDDYDAPSLAATSNGRITLHEIATNHLVATSKDDRVDGVALRVHDGVIESDERVTLGFAPGSDSLVTAETDDGTVRIAGASATSPAPAHTGSDDDSTSQTLRLGAGTGHLDIHASAGNIVLTQEGASH
jgi:hypothetical protein